MNKAKKKLCIIVPNHWSVIMGGAPYESKVMIEALSKLDIYDIFCITRYYPPDYQAKGYTIRKISGKNGFRRFGNTPDAFRIYKLLREIKPDIIYQLVATAYTGICAYYAKHNPCNMVWRIQHDHDVSPPGWKFSKIPPFNIIDRKLLDYGIANATKIVAQTEVQKDLLEKYYTREVAAIVPNFHPMPVEEINKSGPIQVVWVANLKKWKRPELFVKLAKDLADYQSVRFVMCGRPTIETFEELKTEMDKIPNLHYRGECTQDEVNQLLAESHIFVNTSLHEGFPHTYMQSWMRRVPVVSLGVNPDGVFDKENVGFFADNSYERMRNYICELIDNPEKRENIGENAQKFAFANYSADVQVKRLIDIFES